MSTLLSSTRTMALGTVASRTTGFLRTAMIAAVLGLHGVGTAFNVANTAPNVVYELLLGGLLSSVVVPLLVRAAKDGADDGLAYGQRLLTLTVLVLGGAAVLLVVFAPQLVALYTDSSGPTRDLAVVFARFFLPQVLFYGAGAVMGAYLNVHGRFGPPMWAPVLNNVVVIATTIVFLLLPGPTRLEPGTVTDTQVTVLGVGVTLGIVAQTLVLLPALRATGFAFRPRFDLRGSGLGTAGRLARWVFVYVLANQIAYVIVVRLATNDQVPDGKGYASFTNAFVLWQLPHAVVSVSVITALLPQLSRLAVANRLADLARELNRGLRLVLAVLVPATAAFLVLGRSLATVVFAHLNVSVPEARYVGVLLAVFAVGLVPFSVYQVQLRAFYALQDTRTPTLINLGVNVTLVVVDVGLYLTLPPSLIVLGLAAGQSCSFLVGLIIMSRVLRRSIGDSGRSLVVRTAVRCAVACVPAGLLALGVGRVVADVLGKGLVGALVTLVLGGAVLLGGYLLLVARMRVPEVGQAIGPLLSRLPGRRAQPNLRPETGSPRYP